MPGESKSTQPQTRHKVITQTLQPKASHARLLLAGCLAHNRRCRHWLNLNFLSCKVTQTPQPCSILVGPPSCSSNCPDVYYLPQPPGWRPGPPTRPPPTPAFIQLTPSTPLALGAAMSLPSAVTRSQSQSHTPTEPSTHHEARRLTASPGSWLEDTFIWSRCDVFVVCPLYPNIPLGWQPAPHMCTHPSERRTHRLFLDCLLGPE